METKNELAAKLREIIPLLTEKYSVKSIGLFGMHIENTIVKKLILIYL